MSTITVTNIKATGETASRAVTGVAGAWADYSGSGTTLLASTNVSSATDNGTGDYTFNLTNAFGSANYAGVVDALNTDANNFDTFMHTQAAGSFSAKLRVGDSGSDTDKETYGIACGDLA